MKSGRSNLTRLQQCRIKLLGALCQTQMGAPCPLSLPSPYPCRTPSLPFKVGFGTYRHNDEKCTATVHSYWLYNTIIPVYHKPTITVSLLWRRIVIYSITHGPRDEGRVFRVGGGYWKGHTVGVPKAGVGFLGRGQPVPPHQLGDLGERCELPQRGSGRSPGRPAVFLYFDCCGWFLH